MMILSTDKLVILQVRSQRYLIIKLIKKRPIAVINKAAMLDINLSVVVTGVIIDDREVCVNTRYRMANLGIT